MRLLPVLVLLAATACEHGASGPHATGKLVFKVRPAAEADVFLATEAEVLRSEPVLQHVREAYRTELVSSAVRVKRDPGTMILEVSVTNRDPQLATQTCNQLMQAYVEQRMEMAVMEAQQQIQVLAEALEKSPADADLQKRIKDLELQAQLHETDVRVLEACRMSR